MVLEGTIMFHLFFTCHKMTVPKELIFSGLCDCVIVLLGPQAKATAEAVAFRLWPHGLHIH